MMRVSKSWLCLASVVLVGCAQAGPSPTATARTAGAGVGAMAAAVGQADFQRFKRADRNADGLLNAAELAPMPAEAIALLDSNADGQLSFKEATAHAPTTSARAKVALEFADALEESPDAGLTAENLTDVMVQEALAAEPPVKAGSGNPVILIPGYLDLEVYFHIIRKKLEAQGRTVVYLDLFPNMGNITVAAKMLEATATNLRTKTGAQKVDLVGHSMGGLISRYYLQNLGGMGQVEHLVTLATPHHGTIVSYLGPSQGASQMHPNSDFLKALNAGDETPGPIKYTSIRAGLDEIVIPHSSPIQEGADNHLVKFAMHGTIFVAPATWKHVDAALKK